MNCPKCGQRNPSTAKHCLHCNEQFEVEREGLFDTDDPEESSRNILIIFTVVVVLVVGGGMFLFGFDTYDSKCVRSEAEAAKLDAAPEWERDQSAERRYIDNEARRRGIDNMRLRRQYGFLKCYRSKTGHVDGAIEP